MHVYLKLLVLKLLTDGRNFDKTKTFLAVGNQTKCALRDTQIAIKQQFETHIT